MCIRLSEMNRVGVMVLASTCKSKSIFVSGYVPEDNYQGPKLPMFLARFHLPNCTILRKLA